MNEIYKIERLNHTGEGIAHDEWGNKLYVPFALPGEEVSGETSDNRLEDMRILNPVVDRIKPACRHFRRCGGCAMQHATDKLLAEWKLGSVRDLLAQNGLETDIRGIAISAPNSRRRATFTAKRTKSGAMVGFMASASDMLVEITECALIDATLLAATSGIKELTKLGGSRKSFVKIYAATSENGLDIHVTGAKELDPMEAARVAKIARANGFARVAWNENILCQETPPYQKMGAAAVVPPASAFLQPTVDGAATLVANVCEALQGSKHIVDLFAGCGTFALELAKQSEVHAVEGESEMIEALLDGWRGATGLKGVTAKARDLFRNPLRPDELKRFDAVVIDPPRAGAVAQIGELAKSNVDRIAYVSCNPASFARDAAHLVTAGYRLDWVQVVDQFRWSPHIELVALLNYNRPRSLIA